MVGLSGLEPLTSRLSGVRSNQLSYRPILFESLCRSLKTEQCRLLYEVQRQSVDLSDIEELVFVYVSLERR